MGKKFVGLDGLKHFWTKAKTWITGQITAEVTAKIAEIVANAPEDLDTLKEIADWISAHVNDAAAMNTQINTNKNNIAALQTSIAGKASASHTHDGRYFTETEVTNKLAGKSDTGHTHTKSQITDFPTSLPTHYCQITRVNNTTITVLANFDGILEIYGSDPSGECSLIMPISFSQGVSKTMTTYNSRSFDGYNPISIFVRNPSSQDVGGMVVSKYFTKVKVSCLLL